MKSVIVLFIVLLSQPAFLKAGCRAIIQESSTDTLSGWIVDVNGKGLKNIKVSVKNKKAEKKSSNWGLFQLLDVNDKDTLVLSLSKKQLLEVPVNGNMYPKITIDKKVIVGVTEASDEVNAMLQQEKLNKKKLSDGTITGDQLRSMGATNFFTALSGRYAGLQVRASEGVSLRGTTSFNKSNNEPLYVLDGSVVSFSTLDALNIQDVKSVRILKEATIYGSRGANGAIEVFTK